MSRTVFYCRCGARLEGASARIEHDCAGHEEPRRITEQQLRHFHPHLAENCPRGLGTPTRRFTVYDISPDATAMREAMARGDGMIRCGRGTPKILGRVEATNAANAIQAARTLWPGIPIEQLDAVEDPRIP